MKGSGIQATSYSIWVNILISTKQKLNQHVTTFECLQGIIQPIILTTV